MAHNETLTLPKSVASFVSGKQLCPTRPDGGSLCMYLTWYCRGTLGGLWSYCITC